MHAIFLDPFWCLEWCISLLSHLVSFIMCAISPSPCLTIWRWSYLNIFCVFLWRWSLAKWISIRSIKSKTFYSNTCQHAKSAILFSIQMKVLKSTWFMLIKKARYSTSKISYCIPWTYSLDDSMTYYIQWIRYASNLMTYNQLDMMNHYKYWKYNFTTVESIGTLAYQKRSTTDW